MQTLLQMQTHSQLGEGRYRQVYHDQSGMESSGVCTPTPNIPGVLHSIMVAADFDLGKGILLSLFLFIEGQQLGIPLALLLHCGFSCCCCCLVLPTPRNISVESLHRSSHTQVSHQE